MDRRLPGDGQGQLGQGAAAAAQLPVAELPVDVDLRGAAEAAPWLAAREGRGELFCAAIALFALVKSIANAVSQLFVDARPADGGVGLVVVTVMISSGDRQIDG